MIVRLPFFGHKATPTAPQHWTVAQTSSWLQETGFGDVAPLFDQNLITGALLLDLSDADMQSMGIPQLGIRKTILKKIGELKGVPIGVPGASGESSPISTVGTAQIQSPVVVMTAVPPPVTTVLVSQPMTVVNQQTTIVNSIELASINQLDGSKEGKAPLHKAAEAGDTHMVTHLLQSGATVNLRNNWGFTPFLLAVQADHLAVCELLVQHGADPMEQHKTGWFAIHFAAWKGALKFVEYSIERKSFVPDLLSGDKVSALWYAAKYGHAQITKLLIDYGCNVNISNVYQDTALHWAAQNGHKECVELLLNGGADSQLKNNIRKKPSALAKKAKHPAIVDILKEAKKKLKTKK